MRKRRKISLNSPEWGAMLMTFSLFMLALCALLPPIFFFTFAKDLSYWWLVLLFLYYGLLCWILYYILHRRDRREARMYLGTETYYERFPKERKRDERIAKIQSVLDRIFPEGL